MARHHTEGDYQFDRASQTLSGTNLSDRQGFKLFSQPASTVSDGGQMRKRLSESV